MSVLYKIAHLQNRRDEVPNQALALELVQTQDMTGIKEIAENLWNRDTHIQNDCIKVLYEIGDIEPDLITAYVPDFIKLLTSKNSRLIWGAMMALGTVAAIKPDEIYQSIERVYRAMKSGSVIAVDHGVKVLAVIASSDQTYSEVIFPFLISHLQHCRPKEIPQHAEKISVAVNSDNKNEFLAVLKAREDILTPPQMARIKKLYKEIEKK